MKKRILLTGLCVALVAMIAVFGTVAYLTDSEVKSNVFTTGNVDIELIEKFGDNDPETPEKLIPATGSAQANTLDNGITKEVTVKNTGAEAAFVRVHIAIPSMLDSGSKDEPQYAAYNNKLHWNFTGASIKDGFWNWNADVNGANYPGNGGNWNMYQTEIEGVLYNVYVATYETALAEGETTKEKAIHQVYLDSDATNELIAAVNETLGANWQILVLAEGTQAEGFTNAYEALNTAFGVPGAYTVDWSGAKKQ